MCAKIKIASSLGLVFDRYWVFGKDGNLRPGQYYANVHPNNYVCDEKSKMTDIRSTPLVSPQRRNHLELGCGLFLVEEAAV